MKILTDVEDKVDKKLKLSINYIQPGILKHGARYHFSTHSTTPTTTTTNFNIKGGFYL